MMGWLWYALWLDLWARILAPAPEPQERSAEVIDLADWRRDEHRAKLAAAKLGKKMKPRSAEHSEKISAGLRAAWARRKAAQHAK